MSRRKGRDADLMRPHDTTTVGPCSKDEIKINQKTPTVRSGFKK